MYEEMVGESCSIKKLIKIIALVFAITLVFSCAGCGKFIDPDSVGDQKCQELLQYFNDKDAKGLKSMFCEKAKSSQDLDEQIQTAMKFFQGKIVSHNSLLGILGDSVAVDNGQTTRIKISPHIESIVTDTKQKYDIRFYSYLVCAADKSKEGVSDILIKSSDGQQCEIGKYIK